MIARLFARFTAWVREETRLAVADTWANEPAPVPEYAPCSSDDPRCAETLRRLAECRERMRRMKAGVLDTRPDERRFTDAASTDVAATIRRARAQTIGPVRAVARKVGR